MVKGKIRKILASPYSVMTAFFIFFAALFTHFYYSSANTQIEAADQSYHDGERASTIADRKTDFNKALSIYLALEKSYAPGYGNGKLYYNIANSYFQLEEYPLAALYYYRALYLSPYDSRAKNNLDLTLKKLDLPPAEPPSALSTLFFFHAVLPLPQKLQLFFLFSLATFLLASGFLWQPYEGLKIGSIATGILAAVMLLSSTYSYSLESSKAVILKGTLLYRGAGKEFAPVKPEPLKPGSRVTLFHADEKWLKVETQKGEIGFVPIYSLQIVF